ncbi:hypothetical protein [Archaeoglobus profundus]|uniref:Uncharacterized protein n=1 Tax=Archaeoglobus profundus (strain DSM 5631 / JCM 9629 / NBRC 100127 / Av18) TaxID=572546 RepID=D2RHM6_ARCPA|nr:hypothetical protein [Archaeoglobus profundus]ADB57801.1 hypothetical protein Arcpr_0737 [Archaeoglobus profundus DSM 5631]
MKRKIESGIKIVGRITGGFPVPSFITVLIDPLATPELLIYGMCDYYVPSFKTNDIVMNEAKALGYSFEVVDFDSLRNLRSVRVCRV